MNLEETDQVLTLAAVYDQRRVDPEAVIAWQAQLARYTLADCRRAVLDYYGEHRERIMPADVRQRVRAMRFARCEAVRMEDVIGEVPSSYRGWVRLYQARMAVIEDGGTVEQALQAHPADQAEIERSAAQDLAELLALPSGRAR